MNGTHSIIQYDDQNNKCIISRLSISPADFLKVIKDMVLDLDLDNISTYKYTQDNNLTNKPDGYYLVHNITNNELELMQVTRILNKGFLYNSTTFSCKRIYKWELIENNYHVSKPLNFTVEKNQFNINKIDNKVSVIIGNNKSGKTTLILDIIKKLYNNYDNILLYLNNELLEFDINYYNTNLTDCPKIKYLPISALKDTLKYQNDGKKCLIVTDTLCTNDSGILEITNNYVKHNLTVIMALQSFDEEIIGNLNYIFNLKGTSFVHSKRIHKYCKFDIPFRKFTYMHTKLELYEALVIDTTEKEINNSIMTFKANL
jgi:hypothetical protein